MTPRRVVCSCGWSGADWAEAKDHVVEAMRANEGAARPVIHEVTAQRPADPSSR